MKYWLIIISILIFFLTGCQSKTIQPVDKSKKVSKSDKILINDELEQKYLDNLKKSLGNIQIIRTIKLFFDKDNEQELVILYNNIENNTRSNIAVINSHGIHAIDLAGNDHDYAITDPDNIQVIGRESGPNEIIIPLFNQRLKHVLDFHITMETEGKTCTFKIKSELSKYVSDNNSKLLKKTLTGKSNHWDCKVEVSYNQMTSTINYEATVTYYKVLSEGNINLRVDIPKIGGSELKEEVYTPRKTFTCGGSIGSFNNKNWDYFYKQPAIAHIIIDWQEEGQEKEERIDLKG